MTNKETLKKQIIYRSMHRGSKEMDILLGTFVERYIKEFNNEADLKNLEELLLIEDEILYCWYFKKNDINAIPRNKVSKKLKNFKL